MSIDISAISALIRELHGDPKPKVKLQELVGLSNAAFARWMRTFQINKFIYIAEWHKHGNVTVPYWTWGFEHSNAPKPRAFTVKEYNDRAREKRTWKRITHAAAHN